MGDRGIARGATACLTSRAIRLDARVASNPWHPGRGSYSTSLETALVLLVLSACALGGCGEGTRQAPVAVSPPPAAVPPIAARSFNSKLHFEVWFVREERGGVEGIDNTPAEKPIEIPACWVWGVVSPYGADIRAVCQEMAAQHIPGLQIYIDEDDDLAHLEDLKGLKYLILVGTDVTDAGIAHLKELKGLQTVDLNGTQVTDAGLVHLKELKGLQSLNLRDTKVTDAGLVHLKELKGLQLLGLYGTQVTDAGLVHLKGLKGLQALGLGGPKITDAGLVHLKELQGLQWLDLPNTKVTDAGLVYLKEFKGLQTLDLTNTKVTDAGVEEFKRAMPNVDVQH